MAGAFSSVPETADGGFNFTAHMSRLCAEIARRTPELAHVDVTRVAIRFCQTRKAVSHGLQATLTPLRFEGGRPHAIRHGRRWAIQPLYDASGREMLYLLSFYLPRFLNRPFRDKLITVFHELWHIDPGFNGDLRRHPGRCYAHGRDERAYDAAMTELVDRWLAQSPPAESFAFLQSSFWQLKRTCGTILGHRIPTPKLLPLEPRAA